MIFPQLDKCAHAHLNNYLEESCDLTYLHEGKLSFFSVVFLFFLAQPSVKVVNLGKSFVMEE